MPVFYLIILPSGILFLCETMFSKTSRLHRKGTTYVLKPFEENSKVYFTSSLVFV